MTGEVGFLPFIWGTKACAQPSVAPRTRAVFIFRKGWIARRLWLCRGLVGAACVWLVRG